MDPTALASGPARRALDAQESREHCYASRPMSLSSDLESVPQAIRVDIAKALAQKAVKSLPEGWTKGGASVPQAKIEKARHYLDVALTVHEDEVARGWRASCLKVLKIRDTKAPVDVAAIPETIRYAIGSAITMRGMRKLPHDWVREEYGVPADKLETAVHYLDVSIAFDRDLTAMNWRAQCLKLLRRWDDAVAAFDEIIDLATRESSSAYLEVAKKSKAECVKLKAAGAPGPAKVKRKEPVVDPPYVDVATSFVEALLKNDFVSARRALAPELKKATSEKALAKSFKELAPGKSTIDDFDVIDTLEDWAGKRRGDVGWVYVALHGKKVEEAVAVTVAKHGSSLAIREIEWGRP
jgi:hypothetical protein